MRTTRPSKPGRIRHHGPVTPPTSQSELLARVRDLRAAGMSPKQIARELGMKPAQVAPLIRQVAGSHRDTTERTLPEPVNRDLVGCWVNPGWSAGLRLDHDVDQAAQWAATDVEGADVPGFAGLVKVLVARAERPGRVTICGSAVLPRLRPTAAHGAAGTRPAPDPRCGRLRPITRVRAGPAVPLHPALPRSADRPVPDHLRPRRKAVLHRRTPRQPSRRDGHPPGHRRAGQLPLPHPSLISALRLARYRTPTAARSVRCPQLAVGPWPPSPMSSTMEA